MKKITAAFLTFATLCWSVIPAVFASEDNATTTPPAAEIALPAAAAAGEAQDTPAAAPANAAPAPESGTAVATSSDPGPADGRGQTPPAGTESEASAAADPMPANSSSTMELAAVPAVANENASSTEAAANASSTLPTGGALVSDGAPTAQDELATTAINVAATAIDTATTTADAQAGTTTVAMVSQFSVLAAWEMADGGLDDDPAPGAQFQPSGIYEVSRNIKMCGVVAGDAADSLGGVYGQMFYPALAAFGPNDDKNRKGCGQAAGPACKMEKISGAAGFDLLCEKIQKNNDHLLWFADGVGYVDLCAADGRLLNQTAAVYCCDQELAYDDAAGEYGAGVIAKGVSGDYSAMLPSKFTYLPLSKLDVDFNNVYYGEVKEGVEAVAADIGSPELLAKAETITNAAVRNAGNVPVQVSLWQDDMGLGQTDGIYNIRYGARLAGIDAPWAHYKPFETVVMPDALAPGQSVEMDFSVEVLNFPETSQGSKTNYTGKMKIDAVPASDIDYECSAQPASTGEVLQPGKPIAKPETMDD